MIKTGSYIGLTILTLLWGLALKGQHVCSYEHFSVEDGLPHNTINSIIQDQKGFIWLATTDGICRHDGYSLKTYKPKTSDKILLRTNRVDKIIADNFGRIWMEAYNEKAYCFNPQTETFWGTEHIPEFNEKEFRLSKITCTSSGKVWLLSETDGCICINDNNFDYTIYSSKNKLIDTTTINIVIEDQQLNSWLLTNNGLYLITTEQANNPISYFKNNGSNANMFYSAIELDDEIWFGGNNGSIVKYSKGAHSFRTHKLPIKSNIILLKKLNKQSILIVSENDGFFIKNIFTGEIETYNAKTVANLKTKELIPIEVTQDRYFWFVPDYVRGIYQFDFNTEHLSFFPTQSKDAINTSARAKAFVLTDNKEQTWVQPYGGGFSLFDEKTNRLIPFSVDPSSLNRKFSNIIHIPFFDQQGNLWYNTQSTGLVKATFSKNNFKALQLSNVNRQSQTKDVRAIFQDTENNYWISTKENKIIILNENLKQIGLLDQQGKLAPDATWLKTAYVITQDYKGNIWIGTKGDGIYILTPKPLPYEYTVQHYTHNEHDRYSLSNNEVYSIFEDTNNQIWIGTFNGGLNKVQKTDNKQLRFLNGNNEWKNYPHKNCIRVRCITQNHEGLIHAGTTGGLLVFDPYTDFSETANFRVLEKSLGNEQSLSSFDINDICVTKNNEIYIATAGGGLNRVDTTDEQGYPVSFKTYTRKDGLPSDFIISLQDDADGKLWISSENILTRFNPENEFFEIFSDVKWNLSENNITEATRCHSSNGELLFGYTEGILHFFPDQIKTNTFIPYLALTDFRLFNKTTKISEHSILPHAIDECENLTLSFKQNFFNIEYTALDYENTTNIQYAYQLEGFDSDWNFVQKKRTANYTNVPDGDYTFRVKSTNSEGVWTNNERQLLITIDPVFWKTPLAYTIYFIIFALLIILIDLYVLTIYRLKSKVKFEKKESEMKQKFFIDISHEIRTPLTMISAPVEYLVNDVRTPDTVKKQLNYIAQSSNRMLRLVNQILDVQKIQEQKLKISEIELIRFLQEIFNDFIDIAKDKQIEYTFKHDVQKAMIWADKNSLEKIVMNLLSNAFKFTPNGKSIILQLKRTDKYTTLTINDEGIGISKDKHKKLFTRFVSFNTDQSNPSTGIGLSLVKELAEKHSAKIIMESEPGIGSSFSVQFLNGKAHFGNNVEYLTLQQNTHTQLSAKDRHVITENDETTPDQPLVLIVEDDPSLCEFIKSILETKYRVIVAADGEAGYNKAIENHPDFIVSDIMMPKMDGIELLKKLRENIQTSHTPIILLTAKTNIESKLEGLSYGADDYITKPFSVAYFTAKIESLLEQRMRLRQIFNTPDQLGINEFNPKPSLITSLDEEIMEKIMQTIEKNIDNNEFTVEELASQVGINRTTLFYKLKSLTGYSPVEFIRDIRLKRAAQLIIDSQLLIKEISYMTGFSDLKYFGKRFKKKFNMTPMEYRKQKR